MAKKNESHDDADFESVLEQMRSSRLKVTAPRKAILKALLENHGPFTAEEIHSKLSKKVCDLATVYRCLTSLENAGLIRRCEFGDGSARYEMAANSEHHHHHVICKSCKKIEVLEDCDLGDIDRFAQKRGFSNVSHSLEFFGICRECKKTAS